MLRIISSLLLIFNLFIQQSMADEQANKDTDMTQPRYYYLKTAVKYIPAIFEINGVPIKVNTDDTGFEARIDYNNWLKPNKNIVRIILDEPSEKAYKLGRPSLNATLAAMDLDGRISNLEKDAVLAHFEWPNPDEPTEYPKVFEFEFDQIQDEHTVRTHLWSEAEPVNQLTEQDKQEILAVVQQIEQAIMVEKDPNNVISLLSYVFREDALARGNSFESLKEAVLEQYEWFMGLDGLVLRPLTLEEANFLLLADNTIVKVMRGDEENTVFIQEYPEEDPEDGRDIRMRLYFAKINGEWTAVRG